MRPISDLAHWKAAEYRLFALYAGVCLLRHKDILCKEKYVNFIHLCVALRLLISPDTSDDDMKVCSLLLKTFVNQCSALYGEGFVSYNIHSMIHLPDDFKRFGSLDVVNCFPFESYLGLFKECVHSGYKPLAQVSAYVHRQNENLLTTVG